MHRLRRQYFCPSVQQMRNRIHRQFLLELRNACRHGHAGRSLDDAPGRTEEESYVRQSAAVDLLHANHGHHRHLESGTAETGLESPVDLSDRRRVPIRDPSAKQHEGSNGNRADNKATGSDDDRQSIRNAAYQSPNVKTNRYAETDSNAEADEKADAHTHR